MSFDPFSNFYQGKCPLTNIDEFSINMSNFFCDVLDKLYIMNTVVLMIKMSTIKAHKSLHLDGLLDKIQFIKMSMTKAHKSLELDGLFGQNSNLFGNRGATVLSK